MSTASMKDIRLRINSVRNTMQITKAMQLVASSKLRQARIRMENSRPYLEVARDTIEDIAAHNTGVKLDLVTGRDVKKRCLIVVAGDRGLAGSYNANVFKYVRDSLTDLPYCVLAIGRKAGEYFRNNGISVLSASAEKAEGISVADSLIMANSLLEGFANGDFDEVELVYTSFVSILTQQAKCQRLIPISANNRERKGQMIFEPSPEVVLENVMPEYLAGMIYAAVCDSVASEQAARRVAMDSATKNASEMIEELNLRYNRARQASITQELTEIIAGAENENGDD